MAEHSLNLPGLSRVSGRGRFGLALLAGLLAGLGQLPAPSGLAPVTLIFALLGLCLFSLISAAARPGWTAFGIGWATGTAYFAVSLHWIVEPFLVDVPRHGWMAPFALVLLAGGLALFWGAAVWLARRIAPTPVAGALAWAAALALAELARGHVLTGFPWALLGYLWVNTPVLSSAAVLGPYGLTLATTLITALLGVAIIRNASGVAVWSTFFAATAIAISIWLVPKAEPAQPNTSNITVRLVQPNAPQDEKWDPAKINTFFHRQLKSTALETDTAPDIVIWPETAIPWDLSQADAALAMMAEAAEGTPLAFGVQRREAGTIHNSLAVIGSDGEISHLYDKHHLVPFGEYIPLGGLAKLIGLRSFAARDGYGFTAGPGPRTLDLGSLGRALPLICYEAIFPASILGSDTRPDWLMQVTNDAWFGDIAGPQQHLVQARFRAVEQGLPLVRAANTGISAVIDAHGTVMASIPLGQEGYLDATLPPPLPPTVYARTGNSPTILTMLFLFSISLMLRRRNIH